MVAEVSFSLQRLEVNNCQFDDFSIFPDIGAVCNCKEEKEDFEASHCDRLKSLTDTESKLPRKIIFICSFEEENDADTLILGIFSLAA